VGHVIERHKGRIVNAPGDNILAEFASAVEAVQAAVEIQRSIEGRNVELADDRRMHFRVGLNLGDVIEEDDGTIYGDGVNIAARMEALADEGGICISSTIHDAVEGKLDFGFDFLGERPVKNIAKPVRVYRVRGEPGENPKKQKSRSTNKLAMVAATGVLVIAIVGISIWQIGRGPVSDETGTTATDGPVLALPDKPSIAVLPFDNLSGDPEQEYFSDGLTDDIIGALSRFRGLFVIARNSTFVYKGRAVDVPQIGRELGVRYVLEGSVRRSGERIRIVAQLIDTSTGGHLWTETFDRDLSDVFAVQEEISGRIAGALVPRIEFDTNERAQQRPTENVTAYEQVLRAKRYFWNPTESAHAEARSLLENAVRLDPNYARAQAFLALIYLEEIFNKFNVRPDSLDRVGRAARRAVALDPTDAVAHDALASYYFYTRQPELFEMEAAKCLSLNPNYADGLVWMSHMRGILFGRERLIAAEADIRRGMRLDPNHPGNYYEPLARALFFAGRYEEALAAVNKSIQDDDYMWKHYWTALI